MQENLNLKTKILENEAIENLTSKIQILRETFLNGPKTELIPIPSQAFYPGVLKVKTYYNAINLERIRSLKDLKYETEDTAEVLKCILKNFGLLYKFSTSEWIKKINGLIREFLVKKYGYFCTGLES